VIVAFRKRLENDSGPFQKICTDPSTDNLLFPVKKNLSKHQHTENRGRLALQTWIYFPNREELSFRVVLAFPNASRMGFVASIWRSISLESSRENLVFDFEFTSGGFTEAR
jgi:hypothetical protein